MCAAARDIVDALLEAAVSYNEKTSGLDAQNVNIAIGQININIASRPADAQGAKPAQPET